MKNVRWITAGLCVLSLVSGALIGQDKGLQGGLMRASKVAGMDVYNKENKKLGDIEDVVIVQDTGMIAYGVLSFGGFLGMGDKLFAIPWGALKPNDKHTQFTLDLDKEKLEKAPGFDKKNWPDFANRTWGAEIHTYYGVKPYWELHGGVLMKDGTKEPAPSALMRTTKVIGMDVHNAQNQNLGDIKDIVLDQPAGAVAYVVLSFGGFLGMGDKLFAVPWAALKPTPDNKRFTLDLAKEKLEKAPGFDKKDWPDMTNREWGTTIHTYYGVKPYWEVHARGVIGEAGTPEHPIVVKDLSGAVAAVETTDTPDGRLVRINADGGERVIALGPIKFIERNRYHLRPGETINVKGYEVMRGDNAVFLVTEIRKGDQTWKFRRDDGTPLWD
jgi:sporulation protein YlmC with PRC-barrel domain